MNNATVLFKETLASIPQDVEKQVDWSFAIADKIAARLKELGLSQKDFALMVGKTQAEVSRWLSGTHNFTIRTLAKISWDTQLHHPDACQDFDCARTGFYSRLKPGRNRA